MSDSEQKMEFHCYTETLLHDNSTEAFVVVDSESKKLLYKWGIEILIVVSLSIIPI